jgi:hypothetical protein
MAAPDPDGRWLYLAVRNEDFRSPLPRSFLRRLDTSSGAEAIAWPGPADAARPSRENYFLSMAAPDWIEPDGSGRLALRASPPGDANPRFPTPHVARRHRLLLDPRTGSLEWHPRNQVLNGSWWSQRLGADILFDAVVGQGSRGEYLYGLRRLTPGGSEPMLDLGPAFPWFHAFEHRGERLVAALGADYLIRIRAIVGGHDARLPLDAREVVRATLAAPCP